MQDDTILTQVLESLQVFQRKGVQAWFGNDQVDLRCPPVSLRCEATLGSMACNSEIAVSIRSRMYMKTSNVSARVQRAPLRME